MATHTVKTTYALDVETVRTLEELARRWNVSKSEARDPRLVGASPRGGAHPDPGARPVAAIAGELVEQIVADRAAFGEAEASLAARLFNESGRRRGSLADCMIAASAIRAGVPLATENLKDFRRFVGFGLRLASD